MKHLNWAEIAANDFKVTAEQAQDDLPAAFSLLVSADPHERDELAYTAIAIWLDTGLLDGQLAQVGHTTIQLFQHREVYARSFAALILAEVLSRDAQTRELSPEILRLLQQEWADWYVNETDLRSHTPELGWLHSLAHGADVAAGFAMHPGLDRSALLSILHALLQRVQSVDIVPIQYEDDRLARSAFLLLARSQLTPSDRKSWLEHLGTALQPTWGQPRSSATAFTVQFARALLMFTHFGAKVPNGTVIPSSAADEWRKALLNSLKKAFPFAYPD